MLSEAVEKLILENAPSERISALVNASPSSLRCGTSTDRAQDLREFGSIRMAR